MIPQLGSNLYCTISGFESDGGVLGDLETESVGAIWRQASEVETLKTMLSINLEDITEERFDRLVDTVPARLQTVIDAGGAPMPW